MGVAVALGAVSLLSGHAAQRKQAKAQRQQEAAARASARAQKRIADIQARNRRVAAYKEQRRTVASQQNIAASSNTTSSGQQGFIGSIQSQYASAFNSSQQIESIASQNSIFNQQASARASQLFGSASNYAGLSDIAKGGADLASIWQQS